LWWLVAALVVEIQAQTHLLVAVAVLADTAQVLVRQAEGQVLKPL
jgi:hypothetical protein